jgi:hypothetical protein
LKEEIRVIRNYILDVINYLKKRFSLERGIANTTLYGNPKDKYTCDGENAKKN